MIWTNEDRRELRVLLDSAFMQRFMAALKDACRVPGKPQSLAPGYDPIALAGLAYAHAQGQSSVFEHLSELATEKAARSPLPQEFQKTPPPKPR